MKTLFKNSFVFCLTAVLLINISCNKEETITPNNLEEVTNQSYGEKVDHLAQSLAKLVKDPATRSFIKAQAQQQFDGDYNFLIKDALNQEMVDGSSFLSQMERNKTINIETLVAENPKLQIAVPVNCDAWDVENKIPLVTFMDERGEDVAEVKAYDAAGNVTMLSTKEAPDFPVIVISLNERVNEEGVIKQGILEVDDQGYAETTIVGKSMTPRFQVYKYKLSNLQESWISGKPEVRCKVYNNQTGEQWVTHSAKPKRKTNTWFNVSWYTPYISSSLGDRFTYYWYEEDGGNWFSFDIPVVAAFGPVVVSTSIPISIGNKDDEYGYTTLNIKDPSPSVYTAGYVTFEANIFQ